MTKVAVVLSGCGVFDGSEIHESVVTLLALDRGGAEVVIAAPQIDQAHVVDHSSGAEQSGETRSVAREAARIARGKVEDLADLKADDLDAVIFPGGFGAAKNLCTYAFAGRDLQVDPQVRRLTEEMAAAGKVIGTICIAPVATAKVLGDAGKKVRLTIGNDAATAADIDSFGAVHQNCAVDDIVVDDEHRVVSTPAYMLAGSISEAAAGIEKLVATVLQMCR